MFRANILSERVTKFDDIVNPVLYLYLLKILNFQKCSIVLK